MSGLQRRIDLQRIEFEEFILYRKPDCRCSGSQPAWSQECADRLHRRTTRDSVPATSETTERIWYRSRLSWDFDWPGIQIANVIYRRHGFTPWRFSAADYRRESGRLSLNGAPVEALWDSHLSAAMINIGHAIHEEQLLETLLLDLS